MKIPGYDILFPKSWQVEGIARVIVYVKKTFKYEQILDLENDHVQSIWIRGNFKNCRNIYFCHAYREHMSHLPLESQRNRLEDFLSQWDTALEYDNPNDVNEVHVSLDMNLDSLNGKWLDPTYKLVSLSRKVQNFCDMGNFSQLVNEPTRIMYNSISKTIEVSCIDHIYTNAKNRCSKPTVTSFGASDHDIISYIRYSRNCPTNSPTIRGISYKKFDNESFLQDLQQVDWGAVYATIDLDLAVQIFTQLFIEVYDKHAPWILYQKRKYDIPGITEELKCLMKERDK